ncbi:MAG: NeuD/PglB/VioB family sugar acetyltransferase [Phycisphaeraceae bacterium]|nr:NeuD/PglB/VioB family sugar acetyltransferase [Phycisphaeraceae bacterium]
MSIKPLILLGAGGHARICLELLGLMDGPEVLGVILPAEEGHLAQRLGLAHLGGDDDLPDLARRWPGLAAIVGLGINGADMRVRLRLLKTLDALQIDRLTLRHPRAVISQHATIESGAQVMAGAIIQRDAAIGADAVIGSGVIIEHDAHVGDAGFIGPGAVLCGQVELGPRAVVGCGACILPGVRIGQSAVVAAGAVVRRDVPAGQRVMGVPAREVGEVTSSPTA